jgi:DNA-binding NarL/FixJ family response regulator
MTPTALNSISDAESDRNLRILICEDNLLIAMGWASLLTTAGYAVIGPAETGEKALQLAYQDLPDLALMDIGLKGSIDGISVASELAPLGVTIIFVTADYQRASLEAREFATEILIKPVAADTLLELVSSTFKGRTPAGSPDGRFHPSPRDAIP